MRKVYEHNMDKVFLRNFRSNPDFVRRVADLLNEPTFSGVREATPQSPHARKSGTIDIDVEYHGGGRLLLENKIDAQFSVNLRGEHQADRYEDTAEYFRDLGQNVLTAIFSPAAYSQGGAGAKRFDRTIRYEDLRTVLPSIHELELLEKAIEQSSSPWDPDPDENMRALHDFLEFLCRECFPLCKIKPSRNKGGVRPSTSRILYFQTTVLTLPIRLKDQKIKLSLQFNPPNKRRGEAKLIVPDVGRLAHYVRCRSEPSPINKVENVGRGKKRLGLISYTPRLFKEEPLQPQRQNCFESLEKIKNLVDWWNDSSTEISKHCID